MPNKSVVFVVLGFVLSLLLANDVEAQCAMCKAVVESSQDVTENNAISGDGINSGILYIMFIPYALLGILGWVFFRDKIKGFLREMNIIRA